VTAAHRRAVLALAAAVLLAACATTPPSADLVAGRIALRVDAGADTPARSLSSAFELRGDGERGELTLTSPLGSVVARARWAPGEATLATNEGERRFDDLDALARGALGEALPLRALPAWLRGRPWAGAASRATEAGFEQLGWQVALTRFADGQLDVTRAAPPAVTLRARLETLP
jgi:outer membrane lipoprotein LolB